MSRRFALLALFLCAGLNGCASARYVSVDNTGGVVAIPANTNDWPTHYRDSAVTLMKQKCPQGFEIDREEEVVVGSTKSVDTTSRDVSPTLAQTTRTTSVHDQTEWRIWFHAKGVAVARVPVPTAPPVIAVTTHPTPPGLPSEPVPVAVANP